MTFEPNLKRVQMPEASIFQCVCPWGFRHVWSIGRLAPQKSLWRGFKKSEREQILTEEISMHYELDPWVTEDEKKDCMRWFIFKSGLDMSRKNFAAQATLSYHGVYHNRRDSIFPSPQTSEQKGLYCLGCKTRSSSGHHATRSPQGAWPLALELSILVGLLCLLGQRSLPVKNYCFAPGELVELSGQRGKNLKLETEHSWTW